MNKGKYTVIDGIDASGKGVIEEAIATFEVNRGRKIFDVSKWSKRNHRLPELSDFFDLKKGKIVDLILVAEPTYVGIGDTIRNEIVLRNERAYSPQATVQAYSLDRLVLLSKVVLPARAVGIDILSSRSCASTLTYQALQALQKGEDVEEIRKMILVNEGNKLQLENAPNLLIIPKVSDAQEIMRRMEKRKSEGKDDHSEFDNEEFQAKLSLLYEDSSLRDLFESYGSVVRYLDANVSKEYTAREGVRIYSEFYSS
jgi:thymidylate kinase